MVIKTFMLINYIFSKTETFGMEYLIFIGQLLDSRLLIK